MLRHPRFARLFEHRVLALATCALLLGLAVGVAPGGASQSQTPKLVRATPTPAPDAVIVGFHGDSTATARARLVDSLGHERMDSLELPRAGVRAELIRIPDGQSVSVAVERYARHPLVEFAEPNGTWRVHALPNDSNFGSLWGLNNTGQTVRGTAGTADADIDATDAWDLTTGNSNVVVAVVDTGVQYNHPDLWMNIWRNPGETGTVQGPGGTVENRASNGLDDDSNGYVDDWRGWDWTLANELVAGSGHNDPLDDNGHGTHVAGTIGASGNDFHGVAGVNWNVRLMPLRVFDADGVGEFWAIAKAFAYASRMGAHVVNASFGGPVDSLVVSTAIGSAPGTLFVTSAGNLASDNDVTPVYPCSDAHVNVLCVAASTQTDGMSDFSNFGATSVDLAAPGSSIYSTYLPLAFHDQLDTDANQWSFIGTDHTWNWVSAGAAGGYLSDSPAGSYSNNHDSWAEIIWNLDLSGSSGCALSYLLRLDLEANDYIQPEFSFDSGSTWVPLQGWTGSTAGEWEPIFEDLSDLDGALSVRIRFHLHSDASGVAEGVDLDDVSVTCLSGPPTLLGHVFMDSTSAAAAHVAGAAASLEGRRQLASVAQLKGALLAGVDTKPAFAGTTATGGRLNLHTSHQLLKTIPDQPASPFATPGNAQATVTWTRSASDGGSPVTEYVVRPFVAGVGLTPRQVGNVTQAVIDGLVNGIPYTFTVAAKNAVGQGPQSGQSGAVTPRTVPGPPVNVRAQPENAGASIQWSAPEQDGGSPITGYTITPFAGSTPLPSFETGAATTTFASGLTNGTAYTFRVAAQSVWGVGPAAVSNAVTPRAPVFPTIAGAAKVAPAKPKAGSPVTATVRVTAGGAPVKPTKVACAGAIGKAKVKGKPRAASGLAKCTFKTPRTAKGKRLKGSVSFTARGKRFTKRFAAKLG